MDNAHGDPFVLRSIVARPSGTSWRRALLVLSAVVAVCAVLVATVLTLRFGNGTDGFWGRNPILANLVSSLLSIAISVVILDRLLARRARASWIFVARVSYRGLARHTRQLIGELASLYIDPSRDIGRPYEHEIPGTRNKHPLEQTRHASPKAGYAKLGVFKTSLPTDLETEELLPLQRLWVLLDDTEWVKFAESSLSEPLRENQLAIATWAASMLGSPDTRKQINFFAQLNEAIFQLQMCLRGTSWEALKQRPALQRMYKEMTIAAWSVLDARARLLCNELWVGANEPEHSIYVPEYLIRAGKAIHQGELPLSLSVFPASSVDAYTIRRADRWEADAIARFVATHASASYRELGAKPAEIDVWLDRHATREAVGSALRRRDQLFLVAHDKNCEIAGTVAIKTCGSASGSIHSVYTRSRRQGIGDRLLARAVLHAACSGLPQASMTVADDNLAMLSLARTYGFTHRRATSTHSLGTLRFSSVGMTMNEVFPFQELTGLMQRTAERGLAS